MSDVRVELSNGPALIKQLRAFREDVAVKTVRSSVRRIGANLLRRVQAATPVATGKLKSNVRVTAKYVRRRGVVVAKVVVNTRGKASDEKNAFYWRFVEFGHKTRPSKKNSAAQRDIPGKNFITSTYLAAMGTITQMFYSDLERAVKRAVKRASRKPRG